LGFGTPRYRATPTVLSSTPGLVDGRSHGTPAGRRSQASLLNQHNPAGGLREVCPSPRVSVVIPALNEAENLPYVFAEMPEDVFEVLLVDGHSTDDTVAIARRLYPALRVVSQTSCGKGNALACGIAACRGDIVVTADADGSTDLREVPRFVEALQRGADVAKGSRFLPGGGSADITRVRAIGNSMLVRLVNLLFRTRYSDLCYGFNAFWRYCFQKVVIDCEGFEVETQINIRISKARLNVVEVPSLERRRIHGVSNLHAFRDGWRVLKTILNEWRSERLVQGGFRGGINSLLPRLRAKI
jgi:glycosyltransferase involved in cell wall biosynthesis